MKIIDTTQGTDPGNQQPFTAPSLAFLQVAAKEVLANIIISKIGSLYDTTRVYILSGCVISGSLPAYSITAGWVFLNGEAYEFDGASGTLGGGQGLYADVVTTNPSPDPLIFEGGSSYSVHNVRKFVITPAASGSHVFSSWLPSHKIRLYSFTAYGGAVFSGKQSVGTLTTPNDGITRKWRLFSRTSAACTSKSGTGVSSVVYSAENGSTNYCVTQWTVSAGSFAPLTNNKFDLTLHAGEDVLILPPNFIITFYINGTNSNGDNAAIYDTSFELQEVD